VTNFGVFVRLDEVFVEGLVHVTELGSDYYQYDAARQRLVGERTRQSFAIGDRLEIQVASVDIDQRKIDFSLVESLSSHGGKKMSEREKLYAAARHKVMRAQAEDGSRSAGKPGGTKKAAAGKSSASTRKKTSSSKPAGKNRKAATSKSATRKKRR